jgi:hypothetical protein
METVKFTAKVAHASKEPDFHMVGFSDDTYDFEHYVILQKAFEFDEQDVTQGMDGEYLEIDGQEHSGYRCCKDAFISRELFTVNIDFGEDEIDRVEVLLDQVKIDERLLNYLHEILGDKLKIQGRLARSYRL